MTLLEAGIVRVLLTYLFPGEKISLNNAYVEIAIS